MARVLGLIGAAAASLAASLSLAGTVQAASAPAAEAIPVGQSTHTITVGGRTRTYRVDRPADGGRMGLVVFLHGGGGSAAASERRYGFDAQARAHHFVVVYPQGVGDSWNEGGGCCGTAGRAGVDDVGFIRAVVASVRRAAPIDPRRIDATGFSLGAILSYRLACETSLFAAVAPVSGTVLSPCPAPRPTSVLAIHGTTDKRIPYDGSPGAGVNHIQGPSAPALDARWRRVDRCAPPIRTRRGPVGRSFAACPDGRAVSLVTVYGFGHEWPGTPCSARCLSGDADRPTQAFSATRVIARFFATHHR